MDLKIFKFKVGVKEPKKKKKGPIELNLGGCHVDTPTQPLKTPFFQNAVSCVYSESPNTSEKRELKQKLFPSSFFCILLLTLSLFSLPISSLFALQILRISGGLV